MMVATSDMFESEIRGELKRNESMAKHTSWRVGGPAELFFKPADVDDLALFLSTLGEGVAIYWVGLGSNLLVRDGGVRGAVILTSGLLNSLEIGEGDIIRAEAGVACPKAAKFIAKNGFEGAEFFAGIPGTIGGALAMNAGAFGGETWENVVSVETLDRHGKRHERFPQEYEIAYRSVKPPAEEWFVAGNFKFKKGDGEASLKRMKALLDKRNKTQPSNQPSCGSVFRNPQNDFAAHLIESCGLKGFQIGDAAVSEKHANFIINLGNAAAIDIEQLIEHVATTVKNQTGVSLIREAHIIGERNDE